MIRLKSLLEQDSAYAKILAKRATTVSNTDKQETSNTMSNANKKAVGAAWDSCKAWHTSGGSSYWNGTNGRPNITVNTTDSSMQLIYNGPGSGYAIAHASDSKGDSLHQAFNVIIAEANPYLIKGGLKPDIFNIQTSCTKKGNIYNMKITIPFTKVDKGVYQLNHRGGWGHDPGANAVTSAVGNVPNLEGPAKVVVNTGGGKITEYFVTYTI
jgi:hypothetical protein